MTAINIEIDTAELDDELKRLTPVALKQLLDACRDDGIGLPLNVVFKQRTPATVAGSPEKVVIGLRLAGGIKNLAAA
jgi:hypothetical protein